MKKKLFLAIVGLCSVSFAGAFMKDKPELAVSNISEELKKGANVVVREHSIHFIIDDIESGIEKVHTSITILNKKGERLKYLYESYNKFSEIKNIEMNVYDANGRHLKKIKRADFHDMSASEEGEVTDARLIIGDPGNLSFPVTIEYEYEKYYNGLLFYPSLQPIYTENVALEKAILWVQHPEGLKPRFKLQHKVKYDIKNSGIGNELLWTINDVKPIKRETDGPHFRSMTPAIALAPSSFKMEGLEGNLSSWEGLSRWSYELNKGRDKLSEETIQEVTELIKGVEDTKEKIKILYKHMQENTRYMSVQLGIGGWRTIPASSVETNGWGDCKALSNYMKALLGVVNIESYVASVYAGQNEPDLDPTFPINKFNHVILFAPIENDTVWLECTSQVTPANYLGKFTGDRYVLPFTPEGSSLIRTPALPESKNRQERKISAQLDLSGNLNASIKTSYQGEQSENFGLDQLIQKPMDEQKKALERRIDLNGFRVVEFSYTKMDEEVQVIQEDIDLIVEKYASVSGKRIFFKPNVFTISNYTPKKESNRKFPFFINMGFTDTDEVSIAIPENIHPEYVPDAVDIVSKFGEYHMSVELKEGELIYKRTMILHKGEYSPEEYEEYRNFRKQVKAADNKKVVMLSKT